MDENAKKLDPSCIAGGNIKQHSLWKTIWSFLKNQTCKYHVIQQFVLLGTYPREIKTNGHIKPIRWISIAASFVIQNQETIQISTNGWTDKLSVIHSGHGKLLGNTQEQSIKQTNIRSIDMLPGWISTELCWLKEIPKGFIYILYDCIFYQTLLKWPNFRNGD